MSLLLVSWTSAPRQWREDRTSHDTPRRAQCRIGPGVSTHTIVPGGIERIEDKLLYGATARKRCLCPGYMRRQLGLDRTARLRGFSTVQKRGHPNGPHSWAQNYNHADAARGMLRPRATFPKTKDWVSEVPGSNQKRRTSTGNSITRSGSTAVVPTPRRSSS